MIKVWILAKKYMILLEDYSKKNKNYILNDTYTSLTQVALELTKNTDNTYKVNKYYTRGLELICADILADIQANI